MSDMTPDLTHALTVFFKALVDAERLQIAGRLARKPHSAEQLAAQLEMKPAALALFHTDVAALRRYLVDFKFMRRTAEGRQYWREA